jgi:hypothetical protein
MATNKVLLRYLEKLQLNRLGDEETAGLLMASLPLPRHAPQNWGFAERPTSVKPLGKWYDAASPRRLLLIADNPGAAPATVGLARGAEHAPAEPLPEAAMEVFAHAPAEDLPYYYWERSFLKIAWRGRFIGLAMGLRVKGEIHWWEACNLAVKNRTPQCLEIEMGGAIPYEVTTGAMMKNYEGKENPYVHKHNWVNGHIYARLHANGVCEIFARHVNSMFFDDGADFKQAVPVIGFKTDDGAQAPAGADGIWDGSRQALNLNGVALDLTDVARLATPAKPGRLNTADGFVVLQPYRGAELYGGWLTENRLGTAWFWQAEQEIFPRGMARTLRFIVSLNPARAPRVARYLAPAWWYGMCEEFQPRPILPATNEYDESIRTAREWFQRHMIPAGFEEGMTPQCEVPSPTHRITPSGEGDIPAGLFQSAYRTGDPRDFDCALRSTYAMVDIFVDHATKRTRFPGHHAGAVALPLQRMHGAIAAWLETGDDYLLNTARAVIENAYWWHKNSWPRRAIGRDARFSHTQMVLYRYLGEELYLDRTRDVIADVAVAQWPDGSFGDQGGGTGVHSHAAYIIKPWMGCMATVGVLDYLEHFPDDPTALAVVRKFADYLMRERAPRRLDRHPTDKETGMATGWTYQHTFKGKLLPGMTIPPGPTAGMHLLHLDYLARLMSWYSFKTGDPKYFAAFAESYAGAGFPRNGAYFSGTQVFLFIPWLEDRLWNATITEKGVEVAAVYLGPQTPPTATIATPEGPVEMKWTAPGQLAASKPVRSVVCDLTHR